MKKRLYITLSAAVLALLLCFAVGCDKTPDDGGETETPDPIVVSISVTKAPDKTEYLAGEVFDRTGMVVTAKYNNNTQKAVTDYTVDKTVLREEDTSVTITYKQKRTTQAITVRANTNPDDLVDLVISDAGEYKAEAEALFGDGGGYLLDTNSPPEPWTSGSSAIGYMKNNSDSGNPELKIRFVLEKDLLVSITPVMSFYTAFDWADLEVTLDGEPVSLSGSLGHAAVCPGDSDLAMHWQNWREVDFGIHSLEAGKHTLDIKLLAQDGPGLDYVNFTAFAPDATDGVRMIYVDTSATKLVYYENETFDPAGAVVKAKHVSGEDTVIDIDYLEITETPLTLDDKLVYISYGGKTTREPVIVTVAPAPGIEPDATLDGTTVRLEAENLQCIDGIFVKTANGGAWLDYMPVDKPITVIVDVTKAGRYTIKLNCGRFHGYSFEHMTLSIDDGEPETLSAAGSIPSTGEFYEANLVTLGTFEFTEGTHTLVFVNDYTSDGGLGGIGVDWFEFSDADRTVFSVTYDLNGGDGETPVETDRETGESFALAAAPVRDGYEFKGWSDGETAYGAGDTYTMPATDVTFTAVWEKNFDAEVNGGTTRIEAETLDCVDGVTLKPADSNPGWLDYMPVGKPVTVKVLVTKAGSYTVKLNCGRFHGYSFEHMTLSIDDGEPETLSAVESIPSTNEFYEANLVTLGTFEFAEGTHTLVFVNDYTSDGGLGGIGIDYFEFVEVTA